MGQQIAMWSTAKILDKLGKADGPGSLWPVLQRRDNGGYVVAWSAMLTELAKTESTS